MSTFSDKVTESMQTLMSTAWNETAGTTVPKTADVALKNGAVRLEAAYLYADLGQSTLLQKNFKDWFAAQIIRMYLNGTSQIIRNNGGSLKSFDGDRVMGIFVGDNKRNIAASTALQINWLVSQCISPIIKERLKDQPTKWTMTHGVGVDVGEAFITRAGVRNASGETTHNDLISVGRAPNIAAKLSAIRDLGGGSIVITKDVYSCLNKPQLVSGPDEEPMWTGSYSRTVGPYTLPLYASTWYRTP